MAEITSLTLAVDSRQVGSATAALDRFAQAGKRTENATQSLASNLRGLRNLFGGISAAVVARQIVLAADAYSNLNARLSLVTRSATEFAAAQKAIFDISQQTRVGLEQTSDLFGSLSRSTEALGVSQESVLGVTRTINQALLVSGTSAQSAAAALVQLGQGFASGALRGEELNSILEQAPRLARAIADGLGVPIGKLRELGAAGELTGEKVFRALQKSARSIESEFGRLPLTVGQATTQSENAILKLIGTIDKASGATTSLAETISSAATFISELADEIERGSKGADDIGFLASAFRVVSETIRVLYANVVFVFEGIGREIATVAAQLVALSNLDLDGFKAISEAAREDAERARAELDAYERRVLVLSRLQLPDLGQTDPRELARRGGPAKPFGTAAADEDDKKKKKGADPFGNALKSLREQIALVGQLTELEKVNAKLSVGSYGAISKAQADRLRGLASELDLRENLQAAADASLGLDVAKIKRGLDGLTSAYTAAESILEAQRDAGLIDERDYYQAKLSFISLNEAAQVQALQAENARLGQEKASGKERIDNLERIAENEARIAIIRADAAAQGTLLGTQQASDARKIAIGFQEAEAAAQSYLDTLRNAQRNAVEGLGLGNQERERRAGRQQIEDTYAQQRLQLESERRRGQISAEQYDQELARIQRFQGAALSSYDDYYRQLIEKQGAFNVGASEALNNYLTDAQDIAAQTEQLFTDAFQGAEDALVKFVQTGKLDFKSLADSIAADIIRIAVKQSVLGPLAESLKSISSPSSQSSGSTGSSTGGTLAGLASFFGGFFANGGDPPMGKVSVVGENGPELFVPKNRGTIVPLQPAGGGGSSGQRPVSVTNNFVLSAPASKATQSQVATAAGRGLQRAMARDN